MHQPRKQDAERGQALVEFALTVPIFLMLVFGIIDLARLVFAYTQVIDAARQGVRYGIVEGLDQGNYQYLDCTGIENAALDTLHAERIRFQAARAVGQGGGTVAYRARIHVGESERGGRPAGPLGAGGAILVPGPDQVASHSRGGPGRLVDAGQRVRVGPHDQ